MGHRIIKLVVQINYAENETQIFGRNHETYYQYLLEYSSDNKTLHTLVDKTENKTDVPHDYVELRTPIKARFVSLTNYSVPSGTFALAGLRVFGNGGGTEPEKTKKIDVVRSAADRYVVNLKWNENKDAVGFNISYGIDKDKLYHTHQVLDADSVTIRNLNRESKYYFIIDAFNENGISKGSKIIGVE